MIRKAAVNKRMQVGPLTVRHVSGFRVPILIFAPMGWGVGKVGPTAPSIALRGRIRPLLWGFLWFILVTVGAHRIGENESHSQCRGPPGPAPTVPAIFNSLIIQPLRKQGLPANCKGENINEKWISFYFFIFFNFVWALLL